MAPLKRRTCLLLKLFTCLLLLGCGSDGDLSKVRGRVTLDGKPLEGAVVQFQPVERGGSSSTGITDEDGHYELMHTFRAAGALRGEHVITIRTASVYYEDEDCDCDHKENIPAKYNAQTQLRRRVEAARNVIDFDLEE